MKIGLLRKSQSYVPEAYAYKKFLEDYDHKVTIFSNPNLVKEFDTVIQFMGFYPYKLSNNVRFIHEYNSLSLQPYPYFKNFIKIKLNHKPTKRIFLNSFVRYFFNFNDSVEFIDRDMGVDIKFFNVKNNKKLNTTFDIVYTGSLANREGIFKCISNLCNKGFKIAIIGNVENRFYEKFKELSNIYLLGELTIDEICKVYEETQCGLNYTPNQFPFNYQTSTKTLEYSAAGLKILSNNYFWVNSFEKSRAAKFFYLENLDNKDQIFNYKFVDANINDKEWSKILRKTKFKEFIET